jgi:serine/threonine protein kinase
MKVVEQIVDYFSNLHDIKGIAHLDITVNNILVHKLNTTIKVFDFGCSQLMSSVPMITHNTPYYSAPEQVDRRLTVSYKAMDIF